MAVLRAAREHAQKKTAHATEQDRPDILKRRKEWFDGQLDLDPGQLIFIDETWASTNMARRYGRAPRGERLRAGVPHGHWKTTTFVAGPSRTGMIAPWVLDGPINGDAFTTYVTRVLVPELPPGNVVIMDNLSSHKAPAVRAAIEAAGARLLFLPPYSPDFNPIENGLFKAEGASAESRRADHPRPLECHRPHRRPLLAPGMLELLRSRWLRCRLIRNRSN
ncbi:IS630 family transposase [Sphingomonas sp. BT553]|uniref:IS630 family transposase n=1 Tax=Sphingomonas mollis TaxID=2795726 RepID=A0ABS0XUJ0_9SPHN|nr:IS630 family transposase [Sphingomonas sp. BT553]